jgi:hypothetical protein
MRECRAFRPELMRPRLRNMILCPIRDSQLGDICDIDNQAGRAEASIQRRYHGLPTGQQDGRAVACLQERHDLADAPRRVIAKRCGFHAPRPATAARIRAGVTGTWQISIPSAASASLTALATAAAAGMVAPSPIPFCPKLV